jgi:uncharacterized Tic20 family protein
MTKRRRWRARRARPSAWAILLLLAALIALLMAVGLLATGPVVS